MENTQEQNVFRDSKSPEVISFIKEVKRYIKETHGEVPSEYSIALKILADNYARYLNCSSALEKEGVVFKADNGRMFVSPIYRVLKDSENTIQSIIKQFGLTSASRAKIKLIDSQSDTESYLDDLVR